MTLPLPCGRGFYCPSGSANQHPCPAGTYGNMSGLVEQWQCSACDPGMYCKGTGMMHPICLTPIDYLSDIRHRYLSCRQLQYNFSNIYQLEVNDSSFLNVKLKIKLCLFEGRTSPSGQCASGFVCVGGASEPSPSDNLTGFPCPPGFFCATGNSVPKPCPKGTFRYPTVSPYTWIINTIITRIWIMSLSYF